MFKFLIVRKLVSWQEPRTSVFQDMCGSTIKCIKGAKGGREVWHPFSKVKKIQDPLRPGKIFIQEAWDRSSACFALGLFEQ